MACKCCTQYAPKHHDGSPLPPCAGTAALQEARDIARLWHGRAKEVGWVPTITSVTVKDAPTVVHIAGRDQHGNPVKETMTLGSDTVVSKHAYSSIGHHPGPSAPLKDKLAAHLAECIAHGEELIYCQGPDRHHAIVGSPMGEQMVERGCFHCDAFPEIQT